MTTPDDARAMFSTMVNQIPPTMTGTVAVLSNTAGLGSVRGADGQIDLEELTKLINGVRATLLFSVVEVENRLEKLEGRPGISDGVLESIMIEFGALGGR